MCICSRLNMIIWVVMVSHTVQLSKKMLMVMVLMCVWSVLSPLPSGAQLFLSLISSSLLSAEHTGLTVALYTFKSGGVKVSVFCWLCWRCEKASPPSLCPRTEQWKHSCRFTHPRPIGARVLWVRMSRASACLKLRSRFLCAAEIVFTWEGDCTASVVFLSKLNEERGKSRNGCTYAEFNEKRHKEVKIEK